eukprot:g4856.t1
MATIEFTCSKDAEPSAMSVYVHLDDGLIPVRSNPIRTTAVLVASALFLTAASLFHFRPFSPRLTIISFSSHPSSSSSDPNAFKPTWGVGPVLVKPGAPGPLQFPFAAKGGVGCLFSYGTMPSLLTGEEDFQDGAIKEEGWLYGAVLEGSGSMWAKPTGKPDDIVKGSLLCWPADTFQAKLAETDTFWEFPSDTADGVQRAVQRVVKADGDTVDAMVYYQPVLDTPATQKPKERKYSLKLQVKNDFEVPCTDKFDEGASLSAYMQLPATETFLSVDMPLGARMVLLDKTHYKVAAPGVKFFKFQVQPDIYVTMQQTKDSLMLLIDKVELNSETFASLENRYILEQHTEISWRDADPKTGTPAAIICKASADVQVDPPPPFSYVPTKMLRGLSNLMVSSFQSIQVGHIKALARDYQKWANDPAYRQAKGNKA